jgi:hypothetical protein
MWDEDDFGHPLLAVQMPWQMNARDNRTMTMAIPEFRSEDDEFEFWSQADSTEYVDWSTAERVKFPKLKPTETDSQEFGKNFE